MASQYYFKTRWLVHAPVSAVYPLINNAEGWPLWWPSVRSVTPITAAANSEKQRQHWRTPMGYAFSFDLELLERLPEKRLHAVATGMLEGTGTWTFEDTERGCVVTFIWDVRTNKAWMNQLSWLLRPVFHYNHYLVMEQGRRGLGKMLTCRVERLIRRGG